MEEFSAVLPAAPPQINKCKCDCGPYHSSQQVTSHSSLLGAQPSPHQWNKYLWAPSRALLPATAPAAEGTAKLAPAVETAPEAAIPVLQGPTHCCCFTLNPSIPDVSVAIRPFSHAHPPTTSMVALTHVSRFKACPSRRLLPIASKSTNSDKVLQSFRCCRTFWSH